MITLPDLCWAWQSIGEQFYQRFLLNEKILCNIECLIQTERKKNLSLIGISWMKFQRYYKHKLTTTFCGMFDNIAERKLGIFRISSHFWPGKLFLTKSTWYETAMWEINVRQSKKKKQHQTWISTLGRMVKERWFSIVQKKFCLAKVVQIQMLNLIRKNLWTYVCNM